LARYFPIQQLIIHRIAYRESITVFPRGERGEGKKEGVK